MTEYEFQKMLLDFSKRVGQNEVAKQIGVSPSYLNRVISGQKPPSKKILAHFGLEREPIYKRVDA